MNVETRMPEPVFLRVIDLSGIHTCFHQRLWVWVNPDPQTVDKLFRLLALAPESYKVLFPEALDTLAEFLSVVWSKAGEESRVSVEEVREIYFFCMSHGFTFEWWQIYFDTVSIMLQFAREYRQALGLWAIFHPRIGTNLPLFPEGRVFCLN